MNTLTRIILTAAATFAGASAALGGGPATTDISYQGYLEQDGAPFEGGTVTMHFIVWDAATAGEALAVTDPGVSVEVDPETGFFSAEPALNTIVFHPVTGDPLPIFNGEDRWLSISVNGQTLEPRKRMNPAPVAVDIVETSKPWINDRGVVRLNYAAVAEAPHMRTGILEITGGSDIAEPFNIAGEPAPGMVVSIDPERIGEMRVSDEAYDARVAGIISGAGGVNPGLTLTQTGTVADGEHPVALSGRVWCYVDADAGGPVRAGDLLTTSSTPGHAMKAANAERAHGAVLGKAMSSLEEGRGLVLVLVNLQ